MTHAKAASPTSRTPAALASTTVRTTGITAYGCAPDEAAMFRALAPGFDVVPTLTDAAVSESTAELAWGNRSISVSHKTHITNPTLRALSRIGVEYISTRSGGYDHIDVDYARGVGIRVENVAYSPASVADYTLMLMLMVVRNARSIIRRVDAHDYRLIDSRGRELRDLTVGVIGTGRIGGAVVDRLRGFGCRVIAYDVRPKIAVDYLPLDDLLSQSDLLTLHTPLTASTHHLLDRRRIGQLKADAYVVNTGRGALIDTDALLDALESGRLGGAALDVLEGEEGLFYTDHRGAPVADRVIRLQALPGVIISPHTAFYTDHALADTISNSLRNCVRFERGEDRG